MKDKAKKRNPYLLPLTMLLLSFLMLLGVTLLRHFGINRERRSLVLINGHTEGSDVEVSFLRNQDKIWYDDRWPVRRQDREPQGIYCSYGLEHVHKNQGKILDRLKSLEWNIYNQG